MSSLDSLVLPWAGCGTVGLVGLGALGLFLDSGAGLRELAFTNTPKNWPLSDFFSTLK